MGQFFRHLVTLLMSIVNFFQNDSTPPERKLSEDGNEPSFEPQRVKSNEPTLSLRWNMKQRKRITGKARISLETQQNIYGKARIIAASESKPLTQQQVEDQAKMDEMLNSL